MGWSTASCRPVNVVVKKLLLAVTGLCLGLTIVLFARTLTLESRQLNPQQIEPPAVGGSLVVGHLAAALRFPTVSSADATQNANKNPADAFVGFRGWMEETYPRLHHSPEVLEHELVAEASLLYQWQGADPELKPVLLLAHQDVVPASPEGWTHPPFAGRVADDFVWGRGALDDKGSLVAILEAAEYLLKAGFRPRRTLLLAFGHDEEIGGGGARALADLLERRVGRVQFVLDEGLAVVDGGSLGVDSPVALVGLAEKGYVTLELRVRSTGGHSSMPPGASAIGVLGRAVAALEGNPMPAMIRGPAEQMLLYLAPEVGFGKRLAMANLWLSAPLMARTIGRSPAGNALLRTTTVPTLFEAGVKENMLPREARALVNFRIHPRDSVRSVADHAWRTIADDRVEIRIPHLGREPSPVSPIFMESPGAGEENGFLTIQRTIEEIYPEAIVAPGLVLGGTDARHYTGLSLQVFRFAPLRVRQDDLPRFHGVDERISVRELERAVQFYIRLLENALG